MKIIITGPRDLWPWETVREEFEGLPAGTTIVHGACPTGVDKVADTTAKALGLTVVPYPAEWKVYGPSAGPVRNEVMAVEQRDADACWVFARVGFDPQQRRSGTADMARRAAKYRIPVRVVECHSNGMPENLQPCPPTS